MSNEVNHIISNAKKLPRHGRMAGGLDDDANINANTVAGALKSSIETIGKVTDSTITSLNKLNNAVAQGAGFETLSAFIDDAHKRFKAVIQDSLDFEKRNSSLQTSMGLTAKSAGLLGQTLDKIAMTYKMSGEDIRAYAGSIKSMLPTLKQNQAGSEKFFQGMIKTQKVLQTNLGLTEDQANKYTLYAQQVGENGDEILRATKNIAKMIDPDGTGGAFKMITEEIADAGEDITLQYGKIPGQLEAAVIKAKKFGLSLQQLKTTADGLLDIESSIGTELEYQLLSGRRLVDEVSGKSLTNTFREAALRGDMATQADAMNQILEQEGETLENNLFARQQMSQLLGMDEQSLSAAIQKKKILDKASAKGITLNLDGSDAIQQAAMALEKGAIDPVEFEKFSESVDTRSTEDLLKESLDVQKATFMATVLSNQSAIIDKARGSVLGAKFVTPGATAGAGQVQNVGTAGMGIEAGKQAIATTMDFFGKIASTFKVFTGRDVVSFPGYGKRTLLAKEGAIQLKDNDMVVAGTNLFGGGNDTGMLAKAIVDAINNQTKQLTNGTYSGINAPYYG
jgi:hypothetical protein